MNRTPYPFIEKSVISVLATLILTLSLVFLQEGFTYYVSFQMLALVTVAILIFSAIHGIKVEKHFFVAFLVFTFALAITAVVSPLVVAQNSSNMFLTVIGILGYAVMICSMPHLKLKRAGLVLHVLKSVSSATIFLLAGFIALSDSNLVPSLNRDSMVLQNSRLIDNFTNVDAILVDQAVNLRINQPERIDLFYGEPSFLAIVLFTCLGCFMITSKLLAYSGSGSKYTDLKSSIKLYDLIVFVGAISLLYIQSFSSIIYAIVVIYFAFIKGNIRRAKVLPSISLLIVFVTAFLAFSYEYFLYRITQADSLSMIQRFGFLFDIGIGDLLAGIKDESMLPVGGIHNGLFYIIAISGFGGLLYIASLLYSVYTLSISIKLAPFVVLLVMAIMMQNGGAFSPNKVVLFAMVLLPLACARTVYSMQHSTSIKNRRCG
jgi:hypothetical protein